jgi:4-hydroxybenzoate polyprenyltransferase
MKKTLLTSVFAFVIAVSGVFAGNADLFSYDRDQINDEFAELNMLENYVKINEGITLTSLVNENNPLIAGITVSNPFAPAIPFDEPPLGIPSFWWGCCIGVWGIAVVYFVTEDKEETKQAFKGCVLGTLVGLVLYVGVYVWILGNAYWWY